MANVRNWREAEKIPRGEGRRIGLSIANEWSVVVYALALVF